MSTESKVGVSKNPRPQLKPAPHHGMRVPTAPVDTRRRVTGHDVGDVMRRYNDTYEHGYRMANAAQPARNVVLNHHTVYGETGVDKSTIDTFGNYNFDTLTMTREDRKKINTLLVGDELKMTQWDRIALAKVKLLDQAADMKDQLGARPVKYDDIPVSKWTRKDEPKKEVKKNFLSRVGSGIASAAKKLKFW